MSRACPPSQHRRYGVVRPCQEWNSARSSLYAQRRREPQPLQKRGPKTHHTDAQLTQAIRRVLKKSPFGGEGHRKVQAQLRKAGIYAGRPRILRLMREHNLLAPQQVGSPRGPKAHTGTISTSTPDRMWGTDMTATWTRRDGQVAVFVAVDHCSAECVGIHAAKPAARFEALEPIRQGVRHAFDAFSPGIAKGLALRHDHGSQYRSEAFQRELRFLGIASSSSFVRAPEGNGIAEHFIRALKEQLLWLEVFEDTEALRQALQQWRRRYNRHWLVDRHRHQTPNQIRKAFVDMREAA